MSPQDLWSALLALWVLLALALVLARIRLARRGRRCPRCLRPWDARSEAGWGDLERQARHERRRQGHP